MPKFWVSYDVDVGAVVTSVLAAVGCRRSWTLLELSVIGFNQLWVRAGLLLLLDVTVIIEAVIAAVEQSNTDYLTDLGQGSKVSLQSYPIFARSHVGCEEGMRESFRVGGLLQVKLSDMI